MFEKFRLDGNLTSPPNNSCINGSSVLECTPWVRHGNQGQFWLVEILGGDIAAQNLGKVASYSSGDR